MLDGRVMVQCVRAEPGVERLAMPNNGIFSAHGFVLLFSRIWTPVAVAWISAAAGTAVECIADGTCIIVLTLKPIVHFCSVRYLELKSSRSLPMGLTLCCVYVALP